MRCKHNNVYVIEDRPHSFAANQDTAIEATSLDTQCNNERQLIMSIFSR